MDEHEKSLVSEFWRHIADETSKSSHFDVGRQLLDNFEKIQTLNQPGESLCHTGSAYIAKALPRHLFSMQQLRSSSRGL